MPIKGQVLIFYFWFNRCVADEILNHVFVYSDIKRIHTHFNFHNNNKLHFSINSYTIFIYKYLYNYFVPFFKRILILYDFLYVGEYNEYLLLITSEICFRFSTYSI